MCALPKDKSFLTGGFNVMKAQTITLEDRIDEFIARKNAEMEQQIQLKNARKSSLSWRQRRRVVSQLRFA